MTSRAPWLGLVGLVLAAAFLVRPGALPEYRDPSAGSSSTPSARDSDATHNSAAFDEGRRLLADFLWDADSVLWASPPANGPDTVDILIATIPDPFDSHLDWMYDAHLASLRRAFESAGFIPDRFWIPPTDSVTVADLTGGPGGHRTRRIPRREAQPSVVLFRASDPRSRQLRLLYLVGEIPTSGIHRRALRAALEERAALRAMRASRTARTGLCSWITATGREQDDVIRLVAPVFSGSGVSLAREMSSWLARHPNAVADVITGSATDRDIYEFLDTLPQLVFRSTVQPDQVLDSVFRERVMPRLDLVASQVAILRESSTQYGRSADRSAAADPSETAAFLSIPFPLNIASLRAEYERHPEKADAPAHLPGLAHVSRIPMSLQIEARPRESPAVVSALTAPTLDQVLDEITTTLRARGIRAVGIVATDVRDKLFLAELLQKRIRDLQLFTYESHALFLRREYTTSLRGMLIFSSYPLVLENQWWSADHARMPGRLLPFGSAGAQGTFNAALYHLGDTTALVDLGLPFSATDSLRGPVVWASIVGGGAFLPLFALDPAVDIGSGAQRFGVTTPGVRPVTRTDVRWSWRNASPLAVVGWGLLALTIPVVCWWLFTRVRALGDSAVDARRLEAPPGLAKPMQALPADHRHAESMIMQRQRLVHAWMLVVALTVAFVPLTVFVVGGAVPSWRVLRENAPWTFLALTTSALLALAGSFARVAFLAWRTWKRRKALGSESASHRSAARLRDVRLDRPSKAEALARAFVGVSGSVLLLVVLLYVIDVVWRQPEQAGGFFLMFSRAARVSGGASPVLTVTVAGIGLALWSVWHLARTDLLCRETTFEVAARSQLRPASNAEGTTAAESWTDDAPGSVPPSVAQAVEQIRQRLLLAVPSRWPLLLVLAVALMCIWLYGQLRPTFESVLAEPAWLSWSRAFGLTWFDLMLRTAIVGAMVITLWTLHRLLVVWHGLQRFLRAVGNTALGPAFHRLPGTVSRLIQPTFFGPSAEGTIDQVARMQWQHLRSIWTLVREKMAQHRQLDEQIVYGSRPSETALVAEGTTEQQSRVVILAPQPLAASASHDGLAGRIAGLMKMETWPTAIERAAKALEQAEQQTESGGRLDRLFFDARCRWRQEELARQEPDNRPGVILEWYACLAEEWRQEPNPGTLAHVTSEIGNASHADGTMPSTSSYIRSACGSDVRVWVRLAEEFMAVQVVGYISWVLQHMRRLAVFLIGALLLTTLLISSYAFYPQSLIKLLFLVVLLGVVASLIVIMIDMNRDELLSRINRNEPGKVNWSLTFVLQLVLIGAVPLLALLSSEFPTVRQMLFSWLDPLIRELTRG